MAGLSLNIAGGDGANNQNSPDEIAVGDSDYAAKILTYEDGGSGANKVGLCLPYRAVFMGFGYEAISTASKRLDVIQRSLDFLSGPRQSEGFSLNVTSPAIRVEAPGSVVTFTARVRNTGETGTPRLFKATLSGSPWMARIVPGQFVLNPCGSTPLTITVTIPAGLPQNARAGLTLTVQPVTGTLPAQSVSLTAKTPSALLLVAHDRFYHLESSYTSLLDQLGISYDIWTLPHTSPPFDGPSEEQLSWYPLVLWYTGYDWYLPMTLKDETQLSTYLGNGGRLLLSSPFYIDGRSNTDFARNHLGVLSYSYGMTASVAYGSPGHPLGAGYAPTVLTDPFPGAGFTVLDAALVPSSLSSTAWRADHNRALAIASDRPGNQLVFWDVPLEALPTGARKSVLQRTLGWLGPLGDSTARLQPPAPLPGQPVTLTIDVRNNLTATTAAVTATLPGAFVPDSLTPLGGLVYNPATKTFVWSGPLGAGATRAFTLTGTAQAASAASSTGGVVYRDQTLGLDYDQPLRLAPGGPDLSSSSSGVSRAGSAWPPTLAMVIRNTGPAIAPSAVVTGLLPMGYRVIPNSLRLEGPGIAQLWSGGVAWQGTLRGGESATVTYQLDLRLDSRAAGMPFEMLAWDGQGGAWEWRTWPELIPAREFLPLARK